MNKWLLASIYSAPVAALAVAASVSTSNLSSTGFSQLSQRGATNLTAFNEGLQKRAGLVERAEEKQAHNTFDIVRLSETPDPVSSSTENLELVEVDSTSDAAGPKLVFAKSSGTVFDKAANTLAPKGYSLVRSSLKKSGPSLAAPRFGGFQAGAVSSTSNTVLAGDLGIDGELTSGDSTRVFQDQFDDDANTPVSVTSVPLPAGLPLMLGAFALLGMVVRNAKK